MYIAEIKQPDIANGTGCRVSVFVSGCRHHCHNCFNKEAWDFEYGKEFDEEMLQKILKYMNQEFIAGLTFLGGDPLEPENQDGVLQIIEAVKKQNPRKNIWMFTGFLYEDLEKEECRANTEYLNKILNKVDVLIDGPYIEEKANKALKFRGSSNQRVINLKKTRLERKIILM